MMPGLFTGGEELKESKEGIEVGIEATCSKESVVLEEAAITTLDGTFLNEEKDQDREAELIIKNQDAVSDVLPLDQTLPGAEAPD